MPFTLPLRQCTTKSDFDSTHLLLLESMPYFAGESIKMYKLKTSCMELTIIETSAYLEMRKQFSLLAVQLEDFRKKVAPPAPDK